MGFTKEGEVSNEINHGRITVLTSVGLLTRRLPGNAECGEVSILLGPGATKGDCYASIKRDLCPSTAGPSAVAVPASVEVPGREAADVGRANQV